MNMSGDIRVKTDQQYKNLFNELKNFAVGDMHELFFLCVCLGYKAKKKKPLCNKGEDRFWSRTITPEEYSCYYAIMLKENEMNISSIKDDKVVLAEMEMYANAGLEILIKELLSDYLIHGNNDFKIDSTCSKELPKDLLSFIYEQIQ